MIMWFRRRKNSLQNVTVVGGGGGGGGGASPSTSPNPIPRISSTQTMHSSSSSGSYQGGNTGGSDNVFPTPPGSPSSAGTAALKSRLHSIKNNFFGSPRFHRKKMQGMSSQ